MGGIQSMKIAGGDIVEVNGRPITRSDGHGNDLRFDGYRIRVDGVLLDDAGRPVKNAAGDVRRLQRISY